MSGELRCPLNVIVTLVRRDGEWPHLPHPPPEQQPPLLPLRGVAASANKATNRPPDASADFTSGALRTRVTHEPVINHR